ncbi:MAG: hypothetical protein JW909_11615 [Planctomycetes bacterium]|nr:hypothetical protein [Planctomycetota bacterium]
MPGVGEDEVVSFEDFKRMRLVVGKVIDVADHPSADKLYLLKVDMGNGRIKQLVAGLKGLVAAADINGKLIIVADNLKPAVLRGERSEGMLLAASDGDKVALLTTHMEVAPGSVVS